MSNLQIKEDIKRHLISYLNLEDYTIDMIDDAENLFSDDGLALDSIDSLELTVLLEREYDVKLTDAAEGRKVLVSVNTIADYIISKQ